MTDQQQPAKTSERTPDLRWLLRMSAIAILLGVFVAFGLQNSETVEVEFLWWSFETARIFLLIGSAGVGIAVWELGAFILRRRRNAA